jgi:hypothetical protein
MTSAVRKITDTQTLGKYVDCHIFIVSNLWFGGAVRFVKFIEDENVEEDPVVVAENAGATFRTPAGAAIARKRKLPTNKGKYI